MSKDVTISPNHAGFVLDKDGNLFTTTPFRGTYNRGSIFKIAPISCPLHTTNPVVPKHGSARGRQLSRYTGCHQQCRPDVNC